jgi:cell division protein FtsL
MDRIENIAQTYFQAPWRKQLQLIGLFSLGLVAIALIAAIYLNVSARAAAYGREIQRMQSEIETLDREIEDLRSRLASVSSAAEMEARASQLGFEPLDPELVVYIKIPGYVERQPAKLAPYSERVVVSAPVMPPEYTESLFVWLKRQALQLAPSLAEARP